MLLSKTAAALRGFQYGMVSASNLKNPRRIRLNFKEGEVQEKGSQKDMATNAAEKNMTRQEKAELARSSAHPIMCVKHAFVAFYLSSINVFKLCSEFSFVQTLQ
jgi:hypothetical protein